MGKKYRKWSEWWIEQDTKHSRPSPSPVIGVSVELLCKEWKPILQKAGKSVTIAPASCEVHCDATQHDRRQQGESKEKKDKLIILTMNKLD